MLPVPVTVSHPEVGQASACQPGPDPSRDRKGAIFRQNAWQPALTGPLAAEATHAALDVAARLVAPAEVEKASAAAVAQTAFPRSTHWVPYTIGQGYAGLAVLWAYLDQCFPEQDWDLTGKHHLTLAARSAEHGPTPPPGLFSGLSGLAFSAFQLSRDGARYGRLLATLDETISQGAITLVRAVRAQQDGVTVGQFDAISGLSGIGAYLLHRSGQSAAAKAVHEVTDALVYLTGEERGLPRWHTPAHLLWSEGKEAYPHGNLNCGLAHGVPGILVFLALAHTAGLDVPDLPQAISRTAGWLCANRFDDDWGVNWPTAIPLLETASGAGPILCGAGGSTAPDGPSRCAWCYGSPGIARALWLAGEALDRDDYRDLAIAAMEAVYRRPIPERRIGSPTFCHGVAGLLAITLRFANETRLPVFFEQSRVLGRQILDHYRPDSMLGFRNLEIPDHEIDQPGLLEGSPGIALVLLAAATAVEPTWDRLFLLS
jgi:lantibiotic biosynthesis protein